MAPVSSDVAAEILARVALRELELQMRRLETIPDDGPLTEDQRRQHGHIVACLSVALEALANDGPGGDAVVGLDHVAFLVRRLADELGAPGAPFPLQVSSAIH
jgi:hypothetical protein